MRNAQRPNLPGMPPDAEFCDSFEVDDVSLGLQGRSNSRSPTGVADEGASCKAVFNWSLRVC